MVKKQVRFYGLPDVRVSGQPDGIWYSTLGTNSIKTGPFLVEVEGEGEPEEIVLDDVIEALRIVTERVQDLLIDELRQRQAHALRAPIDLPVQTEKKEATENQLTPNRTL